MQTSLTLLTDELRRIGQRLTRIETVLEPINTMKERLQRVEAGVGKMTGLLEMMVNSGGSGGVVSKCDTEQTFKVCVMLLYCSYITCACLYRSVFPHMGFRVVPLFTWPIYFLSPLGWK